MSTSNLDLKRRCFSKAKKDLSRTVDHLKSYRDVTVTKENVAAVSEIYDALEKKFMNFMTEKTKLEEEIDDTSVLDTLVTDEDEVLKTNTEFFLLEMKSKLVQCQVLVRLEREALTDSDSKKYEDLVRELKVQKEERDHELAMQKIELEQMKLRHEDLVLQANSVGSPTSSSVKMSNLPKVQLIKFSGQVDRYQEFLDNFNSLVHNRADLSPSLKFHYLKGQLSGAPLCLIDGLRVTDDNYRVALKLLNEEYGSQNIVINKLYSDIANMKSKSSKTGDFHQMYAEIECKLKLLENQNIPLDHGLLASTLFNKLSGHTQRELVKVHGDKITVLLIREFMYKERQEERIVTSFRPSSLSSVEARVRDVHDTTCKYNVDHGYNRRYTAETLATGASDNNESKLLCVFCGQEHYSSLCNRYASMESRQKLIEGKGLCYLCLREGHVKSKCYLLTRYKCYHCKRTGAHHRAICPMYFKGEKITTSNYCSHDDHVSNEEDAPSQPNQNEIPGNSTLVSNETNLCSKEERYSYVYLQTATITVMNKQKNKSTTIRAIFDSGSTQTYITKRLFKALGLVSEQVCKTNIYTFGSAQPKTLDIERTHLSVRTEQDKYIDIDVGVVPLIVGPYTMDKCDNVLIDKIKEKYKLADQCYVTGKFEDFDLLIGNDMYHHFITGERLTVQSDLFLLKSVFGFILSGKSNQLLPVGENGRTYVSSSLLIKTDLPFRDSQEIAKFWDLDVIGIKDNANISEDDLALENFQSTLKYEDNRYYVNFPWKNDSRNIQDNYGLAVGRLRSLVKRHSNDGILQTCKNIFQEQLRQGILEEVSNEKVDSCYYLPYHTVVKETSETTKARIAPLSRPTLPRLELLGALIAYRGLKFVGESLKVKDIKYYLWIDSQIVIHWILGNKVLPTFINNRVKEIKNRSFELDVHYVPTDMNPADIACRGEKLSSLQNNETWWHGPKWLCQSEGHWPQWSFTDEISPQTEVSMDNALSVPAVKQLSKPLARKPIPVDHEKFNSFNKLVNVTCYVLKFIRLCRRQKENKGNISIIEYEESKLSWIKFAQHQKFASTLQELKRGHKDQLSQQLGLVLDENNILRCKGTFVELKVDGKSCFPMLLPRGNHISTIIVNDIHTSGYHTGVSQTLASVRLHYWLPQGRSEVSKILHKCLTCRKYKNGPYRMPQFSFYPSYRLNQNVAFTYTGVDYFGPLHVKDQNKGMWCVIFTCMTTRAIHLELVDSESTEDLILAFRRFVARRGNCKLMLSDNASQFKLLGNVVDTIYKPVSDYLNVNQIKFTYTTPLSPWSGGVYERLISIVKQCLRKTLGKLTLSKPHLNTIMVEVEHIVNSRPLAYFNDEDLVITPNHFLGLKRDVLIPEQESYDTKTGKSTTFQNLVQFWKKGNAHLNTFWKHWYNQYVMSLRESKRTGFKQGKVCSIEPRVGEFVLIKEEKLPRARWPYGVIRSLKYSQDGKVSFLCFAVGSVANASLVSIDTAMATK
ncbi:hypothetical protein M8J77_009940 [Diaphorina citri]|nr:hypothetical protein M8J77_009940 [Diaphorina citri]